VLIGADGLRSTVRRQIFPDVDLVYAGYVAWRGMVEEAALTPSTHAAIFHRFGWGLLDRQHILGYPVPGPFDDLTPGRGRFRGRRRSRRGWRQSLGWLSCSAKCPETRTSSAPRKPPLQNPRAGAYVARKLPPLVSPFTHP
jgi:2-polyprenyl-6-methoxyphenol hydroxylase-like FAD-dependent oxidoreductase